MTQATASTNAPSHKMSKRDRARMKLGLTMGAGVSLAVISVVMAIYNAHEYTGRSNPHNARLALDAVLWMLFAIACLLVAAFCIMWAGFTDNFEPKQE